MLMIHLITHVRIYSTYVRTYVCLCMCPIYRCTYVRTYLVLRTYIITCVCEDIGYTYVLCVSQEDW